MNLGREIVTCALRERTLQPFLAAGITPAWLDDQGDPSRLAVFPDQHMQAIRSLMKHWDEHGKVMPLSQFQRSYPAESYELSDEDYTSAELVQVFQADRRTVLAQTAAGELAEFVAQGDIAGALNLMEAAAKLIRNTGHASSIDLLSLDDLDGLPDAEPLIEGILDAGTVTMFYGPSGTGKSFVAVDWALSIASGIPWLGHKAERKRVLYVAAEGGAGYKKRARAWLQAHQGQPGSNISFIVKPVQMNDPDSVSDLLAVAKDFDVIILDTLAKLTAGKSDSDAEAMGLFVDACYKLRDAMGGGTVIIVHHTGYDKSHSRGWTGIQAGIDNSISVDAPGSPPNPADRMTFKCMKRKDDELFASFATRLVKTGESAVIEATEGEFDEELFEAGSQKAGEQADRKDKIREFRDAHPGATVQQISDATGIPSSTCHRIIQTMRTTANTR